VVNTSCDNADRLGVSADGIVLDEAETGKRSSSESVLDLAIECWNQEVDAITAPIVLEGEASHANVIGDLDNGETTTANVRLDALRERVLARIAGKQRRLYSG
jgi:hypothetical protein